MSSEPTQFGTLLRRYRTAAGLTQEALGARAQVSARTIADLERGISRIPRHETLALLLEALSVTEQQRALLLSTIRPEMARAAPRAGSVSPPPLPPTALIGREQEMMRAMTFLLHGGVRLLTLTGPSGVGKTRLAIELAQEFGERSEDGVVYVALAPLRDPSLLPSTLAQALGLRESPVGQISEQVQAYMQEKQLLLVLDNFEHIRPAAPFIAELLATCPGLQVLITSRAPLHLRGEQELALAPLEVEAAVALFRARAQAVRPERDYAWSEVAAICEQVDRLPLAIELAAMHVKVLALPLLLERLTTRFTLLRAGAQDLPERQRTMQSAIAWSYDLLTPAQQRCFRALGVFLGGWTLDAAEAVCWNEGLLARDEVLMVLAALIDHSLMSSESSVGGAPRFSMLETLREFALGCLHSAGEDEQTHRQHALSFAGRAEHIGWPIQETQEVDLQDFPNMRAALHWAAEQREVVLGLKLALHFGPLLFIHGQMREAGAWLEQMLSLDAGAGEQAAPLALRLTALYGAARFAMSWGRDEQATALAQEMLQLAERSGDHASQSLALSNLAFWRKQAVRTHR
jgi:predicted ATPase/transcriptional regulator with XRE-family HTH domain